MLYHERFRFSIFAILVAPALFALDPNKHITQFDMRIYTEIGLPMNTFISGYWDLLRVAKCTPTPFLFQARGCNETQGE